MLPETEESNVELEKAVLETIDKLASDTELNCAIEDIPQLIQPVVDDKPTTNSPCIDEAIMNYQNTPRVVNRELTLISADNVPDAVISQQKTEEDSTLQHNIRIEEAPSQIQNPLLGRRKPAMQNITLIKMDNQPSPVAKILPKTSSIAKIIQPNASSFPAPSDLKPKLLQPKLISRLSTSLHKDIPKNVATETSKPLQMAQISISSEQKVMNSINNTTKKPSVIPIRPRTSNMKAMPPILTTAPDITDHLANTVNKVAAGAQFTPQEDKTNPIAALNISSLPKDKNKKIPMESKINGKGNGTKYSSMDTPTRGEAKTNIVITSTNHQLAPNCLENCITSPTVTPNSGYYFSNTPQFALAPNGNLVAVSGGGMTHYLIRQPNASSQIIPVMPTQQLFFSQIQPAINSDKTQSQHGTQLDNLQQRQISIQSTQQKVVGGQNILYRSGPNIFMPTMIPRHNSPTTVPTSQKKLHQGNQPIIQKKSISNQPNRNGNSFANNETASLEHNFSSDQQQKYPIYSSSSLITNNNPFLVTTSENITGFAQQHGKIIQMAPSHIAVHDQTTELSNSIGTGKVQSKVSQSKSPHKKKANSANNASYMSYQKQIIPTLVPINGQQIVDEEENEPPPILCRDESSETQSLESIFQKEAKIIREKMFSTIETHTRPITHEIDGFKIEEDIEPFPVEHQRLLEKLKNEKIEENITGKSPNGEDKKKEKSLHNEESHRRKRSYSSSSSENSLQSESQRKSKFPNTTSSKLYNKQSMKKARRRELEGLLNMDFGPGKTPFQTFDPDEYAKEVMIEAGKQQKTLALAFATEERTNRRSTEKSNLSSSSTNKKDKDKSHMTTNEKEIHNEAIKNEKSPNERNSGKLSTDSRMDQEHCSYCKCSFADVGRDQKHQQYCSKECRKNKRQQKNKSQSSEGNFDTTRSNSLNNAISNRRSDPSTPGPRTSLVNIVQQKMTSPLGSAFSTVQPQMLTGSGPIQTADGNSKRRWTLDDQATHLSQQQQMAARVFKYNDDIGTQTHSGSGDQMFVAGPSHHIMHPPQQMINQISMPQHSHIPTYFNHQPSTEVLNFGNTQQQQIQQQMMMSNPPNFLANQYNYNMLQQSQQFQFQHSIRHPQLVQSPITPITPVEKNIEIDTLISRGIQTWTTEDVAKWVIYITHSEAIGDTFKKEEIDGDSLVLLKFEQLQNELKLKLGPAVKLNDALNALRRNLT